MEKKELLINLFMSFIASFMVEEKKEISLGFERVLSSFNYKLSHIPDICGKMLP